jgi:hypothetical protein
MIGSVCRRHSKLQRKLPAFILRQHRALSCSYVPKHRFNFYATIQVIGIAVKNA